jgi:hypothetical protein
MSYEYLNIPVLAGNAANAHVPRLQPSAIREFVEMISDEVAAGKWVNDRGEPITDAGATIEEYLEALVKERPHWLVPEVVIEESDTTWESGSLTKQGDRWRKLRAQLGSDAAATKAMQEEAALYGTEFGSTKPGVKHGSADSKKDDAPKGGGPNNPWSDKWSQGDAARYAKQANIIKADLKMAASLAAVCGKTVTGGPLKR